MCRLSGRTKGQRHSYRIQEKATFSRSKYGENKESDPARLRAVTALYQFSKSIGVICMYVLNLNLLATGTFLGSGNQLLFFPQAKTTIEDPRVFWDKEKIKKITNNGLSAYALRNTMDSYPWAFILALSYDEDWQSAVFLNGWMDKARNVAALEELLGKDPREFPGCAGRPLYRDEFNLYESKMTRDLPCLYTVDKKMKWCIRACRGYTDQQVVVGDDCTTVLAGYMEDHYPSISVRVFSTGEVQVLKRRQYALQGPVGSGTARLVAQRTYAGMALSNYLQGVSEMRSFPTGSVEAIPSDSCWHTLN